jgi:hypothetical protein
MPRLRREGQRKLQNAVLQGTLAGMLDKAEVLKHEGRWSQERFIWAAWVVDWWKNLDENIREEYVPAEMIISIFEVVDSDFKQIGISLDRMVRAQNRSQRNGRV